MSFVTDHQEQLRIVFRELLRDAAAFRVSVDGVVVCVDAYPSLGLTSATGPHRRTASDDGFVNAWMARSGLRRRCDVWLVQPVPGWSLSVWVRSATAESLVEGVPGHQRIAACVIPLGMILQSQLLFHRGLALQPLRSWILLDSIRQDTIQKCQDRE